MSEGYTTAREIRDLAEAVALLRQAEIEAGEFADARAAVANIVTCRCKRIEEAEERREGAEAETRKILGMDGEGR